jgi:hypothetical protein
MDVHPQAPGTDLDDILVQQHDRPLEGDIETPASTCHANGCGSFRAEQNQPFIGGHAKLTRNGPGGLPGQRPVGQHSQPGLPSGQGDATEKATFLDRGVQVLDAQSVRQWHGKVLVGAWYVAGRENAIRNRAWVVGDLGKRPGLGFMQARMMYG